MDQTNNQPTPQDEAPESFEFELTDEQLEAVAGGADPRQFVKGLDSKQLGADLTQPGSPSVLPSSQSATLSSNK